jgi:LTXXQ motif family protein
LGSAAPRARVSEASEARNADSFVTTLNMTPFGHGGIFSVAISRSDATGATQTASSFDRRHPSLGAERVGSKQGHNMRRLIYTACAAAAIALSLPVAESFAEADRRSAEQQEQWKQAREQRLQQRAEILDARLVGFKASLALTSDQEKNWARFEAALRNAAKPREPWMRPDGDQGRAEGRPSPIDMMRRFSQRMGERSTKLSALADATTPLYASLDDKQKLVFDATLRGFLRPRLFGPGRRTPGGSTVAADGGLTWRAAPDAHRSARTRPASSVRRSRRNPDRS